MARRRHTRNKRHRRQRRSKNMRGGALSEEEQQQLYNIGIDNDVIRQIADKGTSMEEITNILNIIMRDGGQTDLSQELLYYIDHPELIPIDNSGEDHNLNTDNLENDSFLGQYDNQMDVDDYFLNDDENTNNQSYTSFNNTQGTMDLNELNGDVNESGYTTLPDESQSFGFGGRKKSRRRVSKKCRKTRKNKRRKQIGGACYGRGVGANSYDPNYSIYNTNMLKLFPYKSN